MMNYKDGDKAFNILTCRTYYIHGVNGKLFAVCPEEDSLDEDQQMAQYFFEFLYMTCEKFS